MSLAALVLAACGGVPTTSDVKFTDDAPGVSSAQYIRVIARPPSKDMEPLELVQGFLDACADPADAYEVARTYLTGEAVTSWNPNAGVQVFDAGSLRLTQSEQTVTIAAPVMAVISADRRYSTLAATAALKQRVTVAKDDQGQWRISDLPDGLLLSMADVDRTFRPWVVYYVGKDMKHLVTDTIVLPVALQGTATALVQTLLAAPPADLALVAQSAFPPGTRLTYGSVPVDSGIAEVDLSADVLSASRTVRRALTAQLAFTLQQLSNVGAVRLTVSGQQLTVPGVGTVTRARDWPTFAPSASTAALYAATGKGVQRITPVGTTVVASKAGEVAGPLMWLSVNPASGDASTISGGGTQLATTSGTPGVLTVRHVGASMSKPTWDGAGNVLVADFGKGVTAVAASGKAMRVPLGRTEVGKAEQVKQVAIGPDGVRIVAVLSAGASDIIALGSVVQAKAGISIVGLERVDRGLGTVKDVVWSGPASLLVLVADAGGSSLVTVNLANGAAQVSSAPVGAQSVAVDAAGGVYVVIADTDGSEVVKRGYGQWATQATASAVALGP